MRSRATVVLVVLGLAASFLLASNPAAHAASDGLVLAQQPTEDPGTEGDEGQDEDGVGQDDPDAETGASQEETEEGASAETTGPPWPYQMPRITLALPVLLALGLAYLYWRLLAARRRGGA